MLKVKGTKPLIVAGGHLFLLQFNCALRRPTIFSATPELRNSCFEHVYRVGLLQDMEKYQSLKTLKIENIIENKAIYPLHYDIEKVAKEKSKHMKRKRHELRRLSEVF